MRATSDVGGVHFGGAQRVTLAPEEWGQSWPSLLIGGLYHAIRAAALERFRFFSGELFSLCQKIHWQRSDTW